MSRILLSSTSIMSENINLEKKFEDYGATIIPLEECEFGELIGIGQLIEVHGGTCRINGRLVSVAFKQHRNWSRLRKKDKADFIRQLCKEVGLMKKFQHHPNIIQMHGVTFNDTMPILIVERADETLDKYLEEKLEEKQRVDFFDKTTLSLDVLWGVRGLHEAGIIHGDLKGPNILVFNSEAGIPRAKLSDFGCSSLMNSSQSNVGGTIHFLAPEKLPQFYQELSKWRKKPEQDIYGLGMVIYQIATDGDRPYDFAEDVQSAKAADKTSAALLGQLPSTTPEDYRKIIEETTKFNPEDRASLDNVEKQLRNSLIKFAKDVSNMHDDAPINADEPVIAEADGAKELLDTYTNQEGNKCVEPGVRMDTTTALSMAADLGHDNVIKLLVDEYKADVNIKKEKGVTLIHIAARNGHVNTIKTLKKFGLDEKLSNKNGTNAIHYAAKSGHAEVIKMLVNEFKMDVNSTDNFGRTAIHYAAKYGKAEVVKVLMRGFSMDMNARNSDGWTALHYAAQQRFVGVIKELTSIKDRVNVDIRDGSGRTAMYIAARHGFAEVVQVLAECGADTNIGKWDGWTPLHTASSYGRIETVRLLVDGGYNTNVNNKITDEPKRGCTPLDLAYGDIIEILRDAGGKKGEEIEVANIEDPVTEDAEGTAKKLLDTYVDGRGIHLTESRRLDEALFWAAELGHSDVIRLLIKDYNANVNAKDSTKGLTALHFAARNGNIETIKMLVYNYGMDINIQNNKGANMIHYSARNGRITTIEILIKEFKMNVNSKDNFNRTTLHYAAKNGNIQIINFLAKLPDMNMEAKNNDGWTALHYATRYRQINVVKMLTDKIDVNIIDNSGRTALYIAARQGNVEMIRMLVNLRGDVNIAKWDGWTPLHSASYHGHLEAVQLLVAELGAKTSNNIKSGDKKGCTPLDIANDYGHKDVAVAIRRAGGKANPLNIFRRIYQKV